MARSNKRKSKVKPRSDISSLFTRHLVELFQKYNSAQSDLRDIWTADDYDYLAADEDRSIMESLQTATLPNRNTDKDAWKDRTNLAIKARTKLEAFIAQTSQQLLQDNKLPIGLKVSDACDFEEAVYKKFPDLLQPSKEEIEQIRAQQEENLKKWQKRIKDITEENDYVSKFIDFIKIYGKYGSCGTHCPIKKTKKIRSFSYDIVTDESGAIQGEGDVNAKYVQLPDTVEVPTYDLKVYPPYNIIMDPTANADPQAGEALYLEDRIDKFELAELAEYEEYDSEAIFSLLDETADNKNYVSSTSPNKALGDDVFGGGATMEGWHKIICYLRILAKDLKDMRKTDKLVDNFCKKYNHKYNDYDVIHLEAVVIGSVCVSLRELEGDRPVTYDTLIHLWGTNYGMGILALCRPVTKAMTALWRRAVDNETLVATMMVTVDGTMVDKETLVFRPGQVVEMKPGVGAMDGAKSAVGQLTFTSVSQNLLPLVDRLDSDLDLASLIPRNLTGMYDPANRTATEAAQTLSSSQVIILSLMRSIDKKILVPTIKHLLEELQKNSSQNELVDATVYAYGSETFIIRMINKKMLQEFLASVPGLIQHYPALSLKIDWDKLVTEYLESLGMDTDKFSNSETMQGQLKYLTDQMKQAAEQLAQMQDVQKENEKLTEELTKAQHDLFDYKKNNTIENRLTIEKVKAENLEGENARLKADMTKARNYKRE